MGMCNPQQGVNEIDYCHIYPKKCDLKPLRVKKNVCLNNNCMHNWFYLVHKVLELIIKPISTRSM